MPTHIQAQVFLRLLHVGFFLGKYGFSVLPLSLQSVLTNLNHIQLYKTNHKVSSCQLLCLEKAPHSMNDKKFCVIVATHALASITNSELRGRDSVCAHAQLSCVYLMSSLDVTHMIKMYQALHLLRGIMLQSND